LFRIGHIQIHRAVAFPRRPSREKPLEYTIKTRRTLYIPINESGCCKIGYWVYCETCK